MSFLSPTTIAIAAALAIPPLIALYFLKLKRNIKPVPSTLLWKRAVEDLRVNAPFQRLRSSLLLLLQLLVLVAAVLALGKPMFRTVETHKSTIIILIDQSASMAVIETDGNSRLELAKQQAKAFVENMEEGARAMIIALCDRATVVSAFDTDKSALQAKIEAIEQTDSTTGLIEAIELAEAYTQNIIIGMEGQADIEMKSDATPASVALFTDGKIKDSKEVVLQNFKVEKLQVFSVGTRGDNVGILAMDARRDYERPEFLEISATVENFGMEPVEFDATLYVAGNNVDVQTVTLAAGQAPEGRQDNRAGARRSRATGVIVFDAIEYDGDGLVEIVLRVEDALESDNRAWTFIDEPRNMSILLVSTLNPQITEALNVFDLSFETMTPDEYENAADDKIMDGERSLFDVVIIDRHSTSRLPTGSYFFWGGAPLIDGMEIGEPIASEVIFNWDDTHPILRYTAIEKIVVDQWLNMKFPGNAEVLIEGETSPVLALLNEGPNRYLCSAFSLVRFDDMGSAMYNTNFGKIADFLPFMQNALRFLSGVITVGGQRSIRPGEPITMPVPTDIENIDIERPDRRNDTAITAGYPTIQYADTRSVGAYSISPGIAGQDSFAVNLFDRVESDVKPADVLEIGATTKSAQTGSIEVNEPAWPYLLGAMLVLLMLEWVVYNRRVFV
ncbi:MAG: vWA domain-containing protein [Planctomycetota bacterium]|jgi:hypothetical protein